MAKFVITVKNPSLNEAFCSATSDEREAVIEHMDKYIQELKESSGNDDWTYQIHDQSKAPIYNEQQ